MTIQSKTNIKFVIQPNPFCEAVNGVWIEQRNAEELLDELRTFRNTKLSVCDWIDLPNSPLTDLEKEVWLTYRQALRDITNTYTSISNVVWPIPPS